MRASTTASIATDLALIRYHACRAGTLGHLFADGRHVCYTLEPALSIFAVDHHPAIPAGLYQCTSHQSPKFGQELIMLRDVPGRAYILIHAGNAAKDTQGCILVGKSSSRWPSPRLIESRAALAMVNDLYLSRLRDGKKLSIGISEQF